MTTCNSISKMFKKKNNNKKHPQKHPQTVILTTLMKLKTHSQVNILLFLHPHETCQLSKYFCTTNKKPIQM